MFGRAVKIGDKEWFVMCTPSTSLSEVLRLAAEMAWREEDTARRASPESIAYRRAITDHR